MKKVLNILSIQFIKQKNKKYLQKSFSKNTGCYNPYTLILTTTQYKSTLISKCHNCVCVGKS